MKLSEKDKEFIEKLKKLFDEKEIDVEIRSSDYKHLVLRRNYGDKIEHYFGMTRQGVRWRFHRLFNEIYCSSYEAVFWIEKNFGTSLRSLAFEIVRERVELRKKVNKMLFFDDSRRQNTTKKPNSSDPEL